MNSVRTKDCNQRAWLKVTKFASSREGFVTLRGEMFDGTLFEFSVPVHEYEDQGPDCPPLIEVGYNGVLGTGICEIVLPYPALSIGHTVRVSEQSLLKWDFYNKVKEAKNVK